MNRSKTALVVVAALAALAFVAWLAGSRPELEEPATPAQAEEHPQDPLAVGLLTHMAEVEKLQVGPGPENEICIQSLDGGRVAVELSPAFLEEMPPDLLPALSMIEPRAEFGWDAYLEFLDRLHGILARERGTHEHAGHHEHDHDHTHEH